MNRYSRRALTPLAQVQLLTPLPINVPLQVIPVGVFLLLGADIDKYIYHKQWGWYMSRLYERYLIEKGMPDGWDEKTIAKISKTIGKDPDEKGFFDACHTTMSKHMDDQTAKGL